MGCYCGCKTTANKVKWACLLVAVITGIVLFRVYMGSLIQDFVTYSECMDNFKAEGKISQADYDKYFLTPENAKRRAEPGAPDPMGHTPNQYVNQCELEYIQGIYGSVFVFDLSALAFVLALVPAFMLCCCSRKPASAHNSLDYEPIIAQTAQGSAFVSASDHEDADLAKVMV